LLLRRANHMTILLPHAEHALQRHLRVARRLRVNHHLVHDAAFRRAGHGCHGATR